jgi:anaerobic ribonucleoside-triphosphate reductase activating protein
LTDRSVPTPELFFFDEKNGGKMMVKQKNDPGCRPMSILNLAGFLAKSEVNGPGNRAVLWVQGCPIHCAGCFNVPFQSFSPAILVPVSGCAGRILALPGIDGVTFSGGEPFAQAGPLAELGELLRSAGLSIVTYTGYTVEQLAAGTDPAWPALLAVTDLLIAGPFVAALAVPDPLKGSSNQQVIALGTRIGYPSGTTAPQQTCSRTEFTIAPDGTVTTTGFPAPGLPDQLAMRCRGA